MVRFFFHVDYLLDTIMDLEGLECSSLEAARSRARSILQRLMRDSASETQLMVPIGVTICNKTQNKIARILTAEAHTPALVAIHITPTPVPNIISLALRKSLTSFDHILIGHVSDKANFSKKVIVI